MENRDTRGFEWHKWDLQIYTPNTGKNNQFAGSTCDEKWDKYLTQIEGNSVNSQLFSRPKNNGAAFPISNCSRRNIMSP